MVQIVIGVAAHDRVTLRKQVDDVLNTARPYFGLRPEIGRAQARAAAFFTAQPSKTIREPQHTGQLTCRELALTFATVGQRKYTGMHGVMRGEATGDSSYPFFHDSWGAGKKATSLPRTFKSHAMLSGCVSM